MYSVWNGLTPFLLDTPRVVSDISENIFINLRYFTESCLEGPNNQYFLWLCSSSYGSSSYDEQYPEKFTLFRIKIIKMYPQEHSLWPYTISINLYNNCHKSDIIWGITYSFDQTRDITVHAHNQMW